MAKRAHVTRVFINGEDVSNEVYACRMDRMARHGVDTVELELSVDRFAVADDGALEIYVELPKPTPSGDQL